MPNARLDHVALVVADLEGAIARTPLPAEPIGTFPGEGTREAYVGAASRDARLLLVTPIDPASDGPYARALRSRGAGLHHLGLAVDDVAAYVDALAGSGWYVLPGTIDLPYGCWLARPGVPLLVEVGGAREVDAEPVVTSLEVAEGDRPGLLAALGVAGLLPSPDGETWVTVAGERRRASDW